MMTELQPWLPAKLSASNKKTSLVDDLADIIKIRWEDDHGNFRAMLTSTCREDSVEGTVSIDKILVANELKRAAAEYGVVRIATASVSEITRVVSHASKRYGIDRKSVAARKAEWLALEAAEAAAAAGAVQHEDLVRVV